jgi:hypothetical protein
MLHLISLRQGKEGSIRRVGSDLTSIRVLNVMDFAALTLFRSHPLCLMAYPRRYPTWIGNTNYNVKVFRSTVVSRINSFAFISYSGTVVSFEKKLSTSPFMSIPNEE